MIFAPQLEMCSINFLEEKVIDPVPGCHSKVTHSIEAVGMV